MDGVGEDFSGLPPRRRTRHEAPRDRRDGARFAKIAVVGGFVIGLMAIALALIVLFAPTPYLGTNGAALAKSVGGVDEGGCRPIEGGWVCRKDQGSGTVPYRVKADWAGCWSGVRIGDGQPREISGCISILDHLTAE
ncbi:MAG: hypothetical protein J0H98_11675 [Solirubrobacterales bacterium]|nr:hypothetical protein [Solirubrobacterales bacterium]